MDRWLSIEVFDGDFSANQWWRSHSDLLTEAAITNGALRWDSHTHHWGVVLEIEFDDEEHRDRFRELPAVRAALDAVPDPMSGLLVYPGRGGGSGSRIPRRPRPRPSAGAGTRPNPQEEQFVKFTS
jgi:hypothetical protein